MNCRRHGCPGHLHLKFPIFRKLCAKKVESRGPWLQRKSEREGGGGEASKCGIRARGSYYCRVELDWEGRAAAAAAVVVVV